MVVAFVSYTGIIKVNLLIILPHMVGNVQALHIVFQIFYVPFLHLETSSSFYNVIP